MSAAIKCRVIGSPYLVLRILLPTPTMLLNGPLSASRWLDGTTQLSASPGQARAKTVGIPRLEAASAPTSSLQAPSAPTQGLTRRHKSHRIVWGYSQAAKRANEFLSTVMLYLCTMNYLRRTTDAEPLFGVSRAPAGTYCNPFSTFSQYLDLEGNSSRLHLDKCSLRST